MPGLMKGGLDGQKKRGQSERLNAQNDVRRKIKRLGVKGNMNAATIMKTEMTKTRRIRGV